MRLEVDDVLAWVASPEDLILLKLVAARPRDIADVMDICLAQGQLDEFYLRHWAKELHVLSRWEQVLADGPF